MKSLPSVPWVALNLVTSPALDFVLIEFSIEPVVVNLPKLIYYGNINIPSTFCDSI